MSESQPEDPRLALAAIASSLRAYLEWQEDTGAIGIPRRPRGAATPAATHTGPAVAPPAPAVPPAPAAAAPAFTPAPFVPSGSPVAVSVPAPVGRNTATTPPLPPRALEVIREEVATCTKCGLAATRTNTVFSRGNPNAKLCFIGEAPGEDEDAQGLPFVGRAGQLLDKMIGAMGLSPENDVYVCNIIKCRPPGNRKPTTEETETCIPYLHEQLAGISPKVIVVLGNTAAGAMLGTTLGISKLRGQWKLYKGTTLVMPTYHPSYLLRPSPQQSEAKREAWEDLQAVMKELGIAKKS